MDVNYNAAREIMTSLSIASRRERRRYPDKKYNNLAEQWQVIAS